MKPLLKQPAETGAYAIPFGQVLPVGAVLASALSVVQAAAGRVSGSAALTLTEIQANGAELLLKIGGGSDGELYTLTATGTDTGGNVHQVDVDMIVLDLTSYTPSIEGGYLDPRGYLDRFGFDETSQLTDRYGTGRIDADALAAGLTDADALINGYVQSRFEVPLNPVPRVLQQLAGDIARYLLHRDNAPDTVRDRYKDAIRLLERIADGKAHLGVNTAGETVEAAGGVRWTAPGRTFTRDTLKGF